MEPILKTENPLPGIKEIEIFDFVLAGDDSHYPVVINEKSYHLKMDEQGNWRVEGLSAEVGDYFGRLIENHGL